MYHSQKYIVMERQEEVIICYLVKVITYFLINHLVAKETKSVIKTVVFFVSKRGHLIANLDLLAELTAQSILALKLRV